MVRDIPRSLAILREACEREGIVFDVVDDFTGFVARLTKERKSYLIGAAGIGVYPINRAAPFAIARDKAFTHYVLRQNRIRVPDGEHFFLRAPEGFLLPEGRERSDAIRYARRLSDNFVVPLVVKPNSGKGARFVSYVTSEHDLNVNLDVIASTDNIALVQSFIDAPEYRLFLIDGEVAFAYRKSRPALRGDGRSTIRTLLAKTPAQSLGAPTVSNYLSEQLARRTLSLDSVLPADSELTVDFVANLSAGGRFAGFIEPPPDVRAWAHALASTVSLRVTGVDLFSPSHLKDVDDIVVTDVNGSPNLGTLYDLDHRDLVFGVWQTILRKTFDEPWPEGF